MPSIGFVILGLLVDAADAIDVVSVERKLRMVDADELLRGIWVLDWSTSPHVPSDNSCERLCLKGPVGPLLLGGLSLTRRGMARDDSEVDYGGQSRSIPGIARP